MNKKSALAVLAACCIALPGAAFAASEADCAAQWKSADGNGDGVLVGPEAERYLAYYRVRAQVTPTDGRITQKTFMQACENDVFMAKAPEAGAPIKGANSFTEAQAKDRAMAAGLTSVVLAGQGRRRHLARHRHEGRQEPSKIAVDFKGNVVSQ